MTQGFMTPCNFQNAHQNTQLNAHLMHFHLAKMTHGLTHEMTNEKSATKPYTTEIFSFSFFKNDTRFETLNDPRLINGQKKRKEKRTKERKKKEKRNENREKRSKREKKEKKKAKRSKENKK